MKGAGKRVGGKKIHFEKKKAMKQARCGDFDGGERKQRTKKTDTTRNFIIEGGCINNAYILTIQIITIVNVIKPD